MNLHRLSFQAPMESYEWQAELLLECCRAGDPDALHLIYQHRWRPLDPKLPAFPGRAELAEIHATPLTRIDALSALIRWYDFRDLKAFVEFSSSLMPAGSQVFQFESAVEAVVRGDASALRTLLDEDPGLVWSRSTRITSFHPPEHQATLLHYVAANGVEGYRQLTPPNAVEIARMLLEAGADPNSQGNFYGGSCTTLSLLVSSAHPAKAGLQIPLVDLLVEFGSTVEPLGCGKWTSPLLTALAFGYRDAAEALVRHGARVDILPAAAGLGYERTARELLPKSDSEARHRALALAAQHGHVRIVSVLLDAAENPNRYNPDGLHAHSTPLHQAVCAGHLATVQLLVERGASLTMEDTIYRSTPLGWAIHCEQPQIAEYLRSVGAR